MSAKESPIKSDIEEENKETEVPENTIELETPRASADLGESLNVAKLPNYLSVEPKPFDPEEYETEIDDGVTDEEGRARLKSKVENTIRWRYVKDEAGNIMTDEFGEKIRESNARMVKWSDGSLSLHVGSEIFEISSVPIKEHSHLYIRQGAVLQGQAVLSASAEKDYKSDEEEEWKRKRLQKAKKLADSDDDSSSAEQEPSASQ
ncbi:LEO1 [Bugula neritina]|uniref:LEO1 n=1 Tax=Bugula neritina TaxID=10212 RepID=A0A7J7JAN1_BUGNE|nr:LEO1 [Bugula neritina]